MEIVVLREGAHGKAPFPSMICADSGHLVDEVDALVAAGADMLHLDVMDGVYVPNFGLGLSEVSYICQRSDIPCDAHLMVNQPASHIAAFAQAGVKVVYIHPESDVHVTRTLQQIRDAGCASGLALNPGTSVASVSAMLPLVDCVLVMTVNPGFAGQAYLPFVTDKVKELAELKRRFGYTLVIDGACSPHLIADLSVRGADGFVLGTSALFGKGRPYDEVIRELRTL